MMSGFPPNIFATRKYFASVDQEILESQLARVVKCAPTLALAAKIIRGWSEPEPSGSYFPGDDLFTPLDRAAGLPLGNQTSQFFANVYLNGLDHFVLRQIQPGAYARYVDDFVLFGNDPGALLEARARVEEQLAGVRLRLHETKSQIRRTADGVTFLGWRIFPDHRRLVRGNVVRFRRRMREMQKDYAAGEVEIDKVRERIVSWNAHAAHGDTWKLRSQLFQQFQFKKNSSGFAGGKTPPVP